MSDRDWAEAAYAAMVERVRRMAATEWRRRALELERPSGIEPEKHGLEGRPVNPSP